MWAATGTQLASTLAGFEACRTRYVLHADADVMVGGLDRDQDYVADMLAAMVDEPGTLTVAFNIAMDHDRPYTTCGASGANDWAFMLPIVEMAAHPAYIAEPLYLYEPSGIGKGAGREDREATIGRIVAKAPATSGRLVAPVRSARTMRSE